MYKKFLLLMFTALLMIALFVPTTSSARAQGENPAGDPTHPDDLSSNVPLSSENNQDATLIPNPYGCYGQTDDPHKSTHVPGNVNVVARTECDWANVPEIHVSTTLQYWKCFIICWWSTIGSTGSTTDYFDDDVTANSAANCISGTHNYRGISYHYIIGSDGNRYEGWTANEKTLTC
jgi:hypothetical protein